MTDIVDQLAADALTLADKRGNLMRRAAEEIRKLRGYVDVLIEKLGMLPRVGVSDEGIE